MPEAHGADPGGLIDPALFPCKSADLNTETIASGGDQLASMGTNLKSKVDAVETAWTPIAEPYQAPEQESVYALMTPAVDAAGDVSSRFTSAQGHIDTYASSLSTIKTTLADLETRAADFRTEALAGYKRYVDSQGKVPEMSLSYNKPNVLVDCSWEEHPPAVEKNDALLAEYNVILESISTAATTCANSINGLLTGVCAAPLVPVTAEQLGSLDEPMAWGSPSKEAEGVQQSIQKGFDNFVGGTFEGGKALLGFHPVTGEWSVANIVTTLGGTADFLVSSAALVLTVPASWLLKETTGKSDLTDFLDDRINLAATGWGGMVGWDHQAALAGGDGWAKWKEDGVAAGAEVVFGGLAMIVPGVNAAKIGTMAARVPGMVAKLPNGVAAGAAKTALAFSKAGSFLVGNKPGVTPLSKAKGLTSPVSSAGGHAALDALGESGGGPGRGPDAPERVPSGVPVRQPEGNPNPALGDGAGRKPGDDASVDVPEEGRTPASPNGSGPEVPAPGRTPGSPGGLIDDHGGVRDPSGRGPELDGDGKPDARDPESASLKSGVPASDGGIPDPTSVDPYKATLGVNDTVPELSDAFDKLFDDRTEAAAARVEAVAAQNAKLAELAEHGIDVSKSELTKGTIEKTIAAQIGDVNADPTLAPEVKAHLAQKLLELEKLSWAERDGLTAQLKLSEDMGDQAAKDVIASQDASLLYESKPGRDSFDQVGLSEDGSTLVITEAKGGASSLSKAGRVLPDGTRAPQGSTMYFNDVFRVDKQLQQHLAENPALAEGLADGSIKVSYQLVKAKENGSVTVQEIVLNPNALDLGLGK
ncbi:MULTISPECIES: hypothetical protein [unclassified Pseudoclavibacter]|uniref:hypothetical protein n=1 Tax=unclassified Pseudoclavibacter TaxID=2615177 RepID=UPI001BAB5C10|nr:hypothetical protein [Pseudoclavibacter sp. Marseille-Q4354]MBS3178922.1 hypothetical protein [Pseudoclavibacter sp. Marseille-Q4354]